MIPAITSNKSIASVAIALLVGVAGCAPNARVQLSAATSLEALCTTLELAASEYHGEVRDADGGRRREVIDAFVRRIQADHDDEGRTNQHVVAFNNALDRIQSDAHVEFDRHRANLDNIRAVREIAEGLRRLAIESMSLDDELQRYVLDLLKPEEPSVEPSPNP